MMFGSVSGPTKYPSDIEEEELVQFLLGSSFIGFAKSRKQILAINNPVRILNFDKSGFSLCPKFAKVLASCGAKDVFYTTRSSKTQIIIFVCINVAGGIITLMHINGRLCGWNILW